MTYTLDLDVIRHGEGDQPFTPGAHVYVKNYHTDERGLILITPLCVSLEELHREIDQLQAELEMIRKKAEREFSKV